MTYFLIFAGVAAAFLVASVVCAALAIRFGLRPAPSRFWASVVLALVALGIGSMGMQTHITYSRTVNGHGWSLDSRWFFLAPLVLGAVALVLAIWRRRQLQRIAGGDVPPRIEMASNL